MRISYKAGLLTASVGRFFGRLTGNSIKEFSRGLTEAKPEPLAVDHHIEINHVDGPINLGSEQEVAEFAEANQIHRLGVDDPIAEPVIEFIVCNEVFIYTATDIDSMKEQIIKYEEMLDDFVAETEAITTPSEEEEEPKEPVQMEFDFGQQEEERDNGNT